METATLHVLLIEDTLPDARLVRELLSGEQNFQFELEHVDRLAPGLERLNRGGIDVVLLDLALPDGWGLENFSRVNATAPDVAVVLLTGTFEDEGLAVQAVQRGAQDYLTKARLDGYTLVRALRYAVERKRVTDELRKANAALQAKLKELGLLNRVMMDREERILELKEEVKALRTRQQAPDADRSGRPDAQPRA